MSQGLKLKLSYFLAAIQELCLPATRQFVFDEGGRCILVVNSISQKLTRHTASEHWKMAFLIIKPIFCLLSSVSSKKSLTLYRALRRGFCSVGLPNGKIEENSEPLITPVFQIATNHLNKIALKDQNGAHTYQEILRKSLLLAKQIQAKIGVNKTQERIVFLCPNDVTYVLAQWACWASGHIGKCIILILIFVGISRISTIVVCQNYVILKIYMTYLIAKT